MMHVPQPPPPPLHAPWQRQHACQVPRSRPFLRPSLLMLLLLLVAMATRTRSSMTALTGHIKRNSKAFPRCDCEPGCPPRPPPPAHTVAATAAAAARVSDRLVRVDGGGPCRRARGEAPWPGDAPSVAASVTVAPYILRWWPPRRRTAAAGCSPWRPGLWWRPHGHGGSDYASRREPHPTVWGIKCVLGKEFTRTGVCAVADRAGRDCHFSCPTRRTSRGVHAGSAGHASHVFRPRLSLACHTHPYIPSPPPHAAAQGVQQVSLICPFAHNPLPNACG